MIAKINCPDLVLRDVPVLGWIERLLFDVTGTAILRSAEVFQGDLDRLAGFCVTSFGGAQFLMSGVFFFTLVVAYVASSRWIARDGLMKTQRRQLHPHVLRPLAVTAIIIVSASAALATLQVLPPDPTTLQIRTIGGAASVINSCGDIKTTPLSDVIDSRITSYENQLKAHKDIVWWVWLFGILAGVGYILKFTWTDARTEVSNEGAGINWKATVLEPTAWWHLLVLAGAVVALQICYVQFDRTATLLALLDDDRWNPLAGAPSRVYEWFQVFEISICEADALSARRHSYGSLVVAGFFGGPMLLIMLREIYLAFRKFAGT